MWRSEPPREPDATGIEPVEEGGPDDPGYADELPEDQDPGDDETTPPEGTPRV